MFLKNLWIMVLCTAAFTGCGGGGGASPASSAPAPAPAPAPDPAPDPSPDPTPSPADGTNILLIISDDQGIDASAQYPFSLDVPDTPTINALAANGIVYENVWVTPSCASTRAALLTGRYGINNEFPGTPGTLSTDYETIQQYLANYPETENYASAAFGKWHVGGGADHPASVGVDYYAGNQNNVSDYFDWELTINGASQQTDVYNTTQITDLAIDWIGDQAGPWFAWVAYSAPHGPFHAPPAALHNRSLPATIDNNNRREFYLAAIEALDTELGRLLDSLPVAEREETLVLYIGDNGTPASVVDRTVFEGSHSKNSLWEGGIRAPFVISGAGVTRVGEREDALVSVTDLFSTIASVAGNNVTEIYDSVSFAESFTDDSFVGRNFIYTYYRDADLEGRAVRVGDDKWFEVVGEGERMFNVASDPGELNDLLPGDSATEARRAELAQIAAAIEDPGAGGGPGNGSPIDITDAIFSNLSANCADYAESYTSSATDVGRSLTFNGDLVIEVSGDSCGFSTNAIPNHDFNDGLGFPNDVAAQNDYYEITSTPTIAAMPTQLALNYDDALMLNGVKVDLLAAACFGVGDERTGCNNINQPWRFDPMFSANGFRVDSHNAHTQPNGAYHYHGTPNALFFSTTNIESPVVGFAADGFPIFGSYFDDGTAVRKAASSYQLRPGLRPSAAGEPGGTYDGTFRDDYIYVPNSGDLDECNGMTVDGVYGYYITDEFPYIVACFSGTPDPSFQK